MLFRDVKQGYPVYVFDRKEVTISTGKVTNTPMPHFDPKIGTNKMVVDVNVEIDGKVSSYVFDDTAEVGYNGNQVISVNRDAILREVERVKNQSEEALKMVDYHRAAIEQCETLMKEYSPEFKERTETQERISKMESKVDKLADTIGNLIESMRKRTEY